MSPREDGGAPPAPPRGSLCSRRNGFGTSLRVARATERDGVGEAQAGAEPQQEVVQPQPGQPELHRPLLELAERAVVRAELAVDDRLDAAVALPQVGQEVPAGGADDEREELRT